MSAYNELQSYDNETTRVFVCRNGSDCDRYPIIQGDAICNIRYGSPGNFNWYFKDIPSISPQDGCGLGEYSVLRCLREQTAGLHYIGTGRYNAYLNLTFDPYIIKKEEYNFLQPFADDFRNNSFCEDCTVSERMGYTPNHIENLFHDQIKIIVSAPLPARYIEYLSPFELMEKEYTAEAAADQQENITKRLKTILFQAGRFIPSVQSKSNSSLLGADGHIQDSWNAFLDRPNMDFVFLGSLKIMERQWFESYVDFVSETLDSVKSSLGDEIKELCQSRLDLEFYEQLGNLLTAFFLYAIADAETLDCKVAVVPTAIYDSIGSLLTDLYPAPEGKMPHFLFQSEQGASIILDHYDEINAMVEKGYLFHSVYFSESGSENMLAGAELNHEIPVETEEDLLHSLQLKYPSYVNGAVVPLFSVYNSEYNDYICTTSFDELNQSEKEGYEFDQFLGYVFSPDITDQTVMETPIYRLHLKSHHDHVYTINKEECDAIQENDWYTYEGIAGYEFSLTGLSLDGKGQNATATTMSIHRYWCASCVSHGYSLTDEAIDMNKFQKEGICFHTVTLIPDHPVSEELGKSSMNSASLTAAGAAASAMLWVANPAVAAAIFAAASLHLLFYDFNEAPSSSIRRPYDYQIYVIHDGRQQENFPIFSAPTLYSIMGGAHYATQPEFCDNFPNIWRPTTLRDNENDNIGEDEYLYSEFSSLYNIWKNRSGSPTYIGKMHYRSYLNLAFFGKNDKPPRMDQNETQPQFKGAPLPEIHPFQGSSKLEDAYFQRMGYTFSNLRHLLSGENIHEVDVLTSTPDYTDFKNVSIAEQFIQAHSFGEKDFQFAGTPCKLALLQLLIKAGEYIYDYFSKNSNLAKGIHIATLRQSQKVNEEEFNLLFPMNSPNTNSFISFEWSEYIGLVDFFIQNNIIKTDPFYISGKSKTPYMKDLFLFKTAYFDEYMSFIYSVLSKLKNQCGEIIKDYSDGAKVHSANNPDSRLLAFIGERLTGYFIHYLLIVKNAQVAVVPRAHYSDLASFLQDLYPEYCDEKNKISMVPIFEFYKQDKTKASGGITRYATDRDAILKMGDYGFSFERCIGYLFKLQPTNSAPNDYIGLFEVVKGTHYEYATAKKSTISTSSHLLGYSFSDTLMKQFAHTKVDLSFKRLTQYEFSGDVKYYIQAPADSLYKKKTSVTQIYVATFGRSDIITCS